MSQAIVVDIVDVFFEARKGRYLLPEDLQEILPKTVVLSLETETNSLCIYSKQRWDDVLVNLQNQYPAKKLLATISKAMNAAVHKTTVINGFVEIPDVLRQRAGLQSKNIKIAFNAGIGQIFSVADRSLGKGWPAELSLNGKYYFQNGDGTLIVNFNVLEPELWLERKGHQLKVLPQSQKKMGQPSGTVEQTVDFSPLIDRYGAFFYRGIGVLSSFSDGKLPLLNFFIRYGLPAVELAEDCPALAYVVAQSCFFGINSPGFDFYERLPEEKRTKILQLSGFPALRWVEKLFRKIPANDCHSFFFHDLRKVLLSVNAEQQQVLTHIGEVNYIAVKILLNVDFFQLFHRAFFAEISQIVADSQAADDFGQLYQVKHELLEAVSQGLWVRLIRKVEDLVVVHEQFVHWLKDQRYLDNIAELDFPAAPFPELLLSQSNKERKFGIFPITSGRALWLEGRTMQHCIAGYAKEINAKMGKFYAYHLDLPDEEPATLTVLYRQGESWTIHDIRGVRNTKVSQKVGSFVARWLEKQANIYFGHSDV